MSSRSDNVARTFLLALFLAAAACETPRAPGGLVGTPTSPSPPSPAPPPAVPPQSAVPPVPAGTAVWVPTPPQPGSSRSWIEGRYRLDLVLADLVGAECDQVPEDVKNRTYTATVAFVPFQGTLIGLSQATFLQGEACHGEQATAGEVPICNRMYFEPNDFNYDEAWIHFFKRQPPLIEQLPGAWVSLAGVPFGTVRESPFTVTGPVALSYWFGDPVGSGFLACQAPSARLTFTRQ